MSDGDNGAGADEDANFALLRDCLSTTLLRSGPLSGADADPGAPQSKSRRRRARRSLKTGVVTSAEEDGDEGAGATENTSGYNRTSSTRLTGRQQQETDARDLADFIDYLAQEIFDSLPEELRALDYRLWRESEDLQARFTLPLTENNLAELRLPPAVTDTLRTYGLIAPDDDEGAAVNGSSGKTRNTKKSTPQAASLAPTAESFLAPILTPYISTLATAPPASAATRADACELCERGWIPLSYHHLIPRFVHEKAVRRGWHRREDLQNVAWLCGACHRFVHHFRGHEDLARHYYTVELLLAEEEVRRFAAWAGKLRWKAR